jgi:hypothetical protein
MFEATMEAGRENGGKARPLRAKDQLTSTDAQL